MKVFRWAVATLMVAALLAPPIASADDVHITIGFGHVMRKGVRKLNVNGYLHDLGPGCHRNRAVKIQRKTNSGWKTIGRDTTSSNGRYAKVVADKTKRYRTVAPATASCEKDLSQSRKHRH